jgi:hypothetical protein
VVELAGFVVGKNEVVWDKVAGVWSDFGLKWGDFGR